MPVVLFLSSYETGHTTETFLTARKDIHVVAFDPLHYPYVSYCARTLSEKYEDRFILIGGKMKSAIGVFAGYFGDKRFDMIYIDSGSYPTTAGIHFTIHSTRRRRSLQQSIPRPREIGRLHGERSSVQRNGRHRLPSVELVRPTGIATRNSRSPGVGESEPLSV